MKIKLSYFLGKRGTDLAKFCSDHNIKNYNSLYDHLLENRVECPPKKEVMNIFVPDRKPAEPDREKTQKTQKSQKISKYSKKGSKHIAPSND